MTLFSASPSLSFSRDPTLLAGSFDSLSPSRPMLPSDLYLLATMSVFIYIFPFSFREEDKARMLLGGFVSWLNHFSTSYSLFYLSVQELSHRKKGSLFNFCSKYPLFKSRIAPILYMESLFLTQSVVSQLYL